jgi:hypothetical protein
MKVLSQLFLLAGVIALIISIILAASGAMLVAGPNGWLDLSLVCAIFSIAIAVVFKPAAKKEEAAE